MADPPETRCRGATGRVGAGHAEQRNRGRAGILAGRGSDRIRRRQADRGGKPAAADPTRGRNGPRKGREPARRGGRRCGPMTARSRADARAFFLQGEVADDFQADFDAGDARRRRRVRHRAAQSRLSVLLGLRAGCQDPALPRRRGADRKLGPDHPHQPRPADRRGLHVRLSDARADAPGEPDRADLRARDVARIDRRLHPRGEAAARREVPRRHPVHRRRRQGDLRVRLPAGPSGAVVSGPGEGRGDRRPDLPHQDRRIRLPGDALLLPVIVPADHVGEGRGQQGAAVGEAERHRPLPLRPAEGRFDLHGGEPGLLSRQAGHPRRRIPLCR